MRLVRAIVRDVVDAERELGAVRRRVGDASIPRTHARDACVRIAVDVVVLQAPKRIAAVAEAEAREPRWRGPPDRLQIAAPIRNARPAVADVLRMIFVAQDARARIGEAAFDRERIDADAVDAEGSLDAARADAPDVLHDARAAEHERVRLVP